MAPTKNSAACVGGWGNRRTYLCKALGLKVYRKPETSFSTGANDLEMQPFLETIVEISNADQSRFRLT